MTTPARHLEPGALVPLLAWVALVGGSAAFWVICVAGTWLALT